MHSIISTFFTMLGTKQLRFSSKKAILTPSKSLRCLCLENEFEMKRKFTFFVQETFLMQMPEQPPAEKPPGQQRSSLRGEEMGTSETSPQSKVGGDGQQRVLAQWQ